MSVAHDQACPMCGGAAKFEPLGFRRKHFRCSDCREFVVTELAEAWLQQTLAEHRVRMQKMIREAGEGQLLVISRDPLANGTPATYTAALHSIAEALRD